MKKIILAALLLLPMALSIPTVADAQNRPLNKFYRKYKKGSDVQNLKLPGWLIRMGGKIAVNSEDMDQDEQELAKQLVKKVGTMRLMYSEDGSKIPGEAIDKLRRDLTEKEHFEDLIMIKSGEMDFDLMIKEQNGTIESLFMLYNDREDGEMVFITLKTSLSLDELKQLLEKTMEDNYHEIMEDNDEEPVVVPLL